MKAETKLLSIKQAAEKGIERLRLPIWSEPLDHLKIDIITDFPGPWVHLYCPFNKECNGRDPVDVLCTQFGSYDDEQYEEYTGPLPDSKEYKDKVAVYDGCLSR